MYKTILVPLDCSKRAEKVLPHIEEIAERFESKVVLLYIVTDVRIPDFPYGPMTLDSEDESNRFIEEAKGYLENIRKSLTNIKDNITVLVKQGEIVPTICGVARDLDADLIAIASHGHAGLKRFVYGSVTQGVLNRVNRPLLLIQSQDTDK